MSDDISIEEKNEAIKRIIKILDEFEKTIKTAENIYEDAVKKKDEKIQKEIQKQIEKIKKEEALLNNMIIGLKNI
jgi:hypothetical protein